MKRSTKVLFVFICALCLSGCVVPSGTNEEVLESASSIAMEFSSSGLNIGDNIKPILANLDHDTYKEVTYGITGSLHEDMPKYRFEATGMTPVRETEEWSSGYVMGLKIFDDNNLLILEADFLQTYGGEELGYFVYNEMMDTMGLHVVDVNFDGYKDVIILNNFGGAHSNTWYDCWLWDSETAAFVESESFAEICNPALDPEKKCIYSTGGSGAAYWGGSIYQYINGKFVITNDLNTYLDGLVETELVNEEMVVVREVRYSDGDKTEAVEMQCYQSSELWQLDHPRWYWSGGHKADQWLGEDQVIKVSWKAIDFGGDFFHLYVVVDGDTEYYVGYFFGDNFTTDFMGDDVMSPGAMKLEPWNADTPENTLTYFRSIWTGAGEWFYLYRKSDTELAVMNHEYVYGRGWDKQEDYKEILAIPLTKAGQIQVEDPVIIRKPYLWNDTNPIVYDGCLLGGTQRWSTWIPKNQLEFETEISGDMGYHLFQNGKYLDTVSVPYDGFVIEPIEVQYNGEPFKGLAINNVLPTLFGEKISIDESESVYQNYMAQILTENGLEGEPVHISQIIKTDLENDGTDEELIIASGDNYSIVVLRKAADDNFESIFLVKDIKTSYIDKYSLCEVVDLNYDDVCDLLIRKERDGKYYYQVYEFLDNKFEIVIGNGN